MLYWLGLCQILMANLVERQLSPGTYEQRLRDMLMLGLTGLGVPPGRLREDHGPIGKDRVTTANRLIRKHAQLEKPC